MLAVVHLQFLAIVRCWTINTQYHNRVAETTLDESEYRHEVYRLVSWCDSNSHQLNASTIREVIVDFRKKKSPIAPIIIINDEHIERFHISGYNNFL